MRLAVDAAIRGLGAVTVADALLWPHRSYLSLLAPLLDADLVRGLAHITGGGLTDNVPRMLPEGTAARIDRRAWTVPALFEILRRGGSVPDDDMWRTFNMGIGLVLACAASNAPAVLERLRRGGEDGAMVLGAVVEGDGRVSYV